MRGVKARVTRGVNHGSILDCADNSGARKLRIVSVKRAKTRLGRYPSAGVGDLCMCSVVDGKKDVRKTVVQAVIIRQRRPYLRRDGTRVFFEDNAAVLIKDDLGNPKGTLIKGPLAKEAALRWPLVGKLSRTIV